MRFAALGDIHGNSAALKAALADIDRRGIDRVINLGDSLSGPLDPVGTADLLMERGFPTVSGNHDRTLVDRGFDEMALWEQWTHPLLEDRHLAWIASHPATMVWNGVFVCHATPQDDITNWLDVRGTDGKMKMADRDRVARFASGVDERLILCAHTHIPRVVRLGGQLIVNPGSIGCPAYLDDREAEPFVAETGSGDARYAIFDQVGDDWIPSLVHVPYDATEMMARARANGADSWAEAISTGWITLPS